MSLYIESPEVVQIATELSARRGESEIETIRVALEELSARQTLPSAEERKRVFDELLDRIHAKLPPEAFIPWTRDDYDALNDEPGSSSRSPSSRSSFVSRDGKSWKLNRMTRA